MSYEYIRDGGTKKNTVKPAGTAPGSNVVGNGSGYFSNPANKKVNNVVASGNAKSQISSATTAQPQQNGMSELISALAEQRQSFSDQLKSQQQWYADQLKAQQAAQQQAAQNAYNSNISALQDAYQKRLSGLDSNLASTKSQLTDSYNNSSKSLNENTAKALQEAYISRMMNEKNLQNQLSAQGVNGGATESAIASMLNNYGNARNNIETAKNNSLSQLEQAYNNNMANALQSYNDAVGTASDNNMAYRMQLENDLANNTVSSYANLYNGLANMDNNYVNAMSNYIANQEDRNANLQYALQKQIFENQLKNSVAINGTSNGGSSKSNSSGVNRAQQLKNSGYSYEDAVIELADEGYTKEQIDQYFKKIGWY